MFWTRAFTRAQPAPDETPTAPPAADPSRRDEHIDSFVESYVEWREECEALESAYREWSRAPAWASESAFAAYREALDREEQAACVHELVTAALVSLQPE